MKATSFFLLLLVWQTSFSQFNETFQDGNFDTNPTWTGSTGDFSITDNVLQLTATPVTGKSYLTTPSAAIDEASWEFYVEMNFNPSSSNYIEVYLVSNVADLSDEINGYLVRIGLIADNVSLVRQDGIEKTVLIAGVEKRLDLNPVNLWVRATRSRFGEWRLHSKLGNETNWFMEGEATDLTYNESAYFGIKSNYTSTRSDKFYFDDFVVTGEAYVDQVAPAIDTVYSISENIIRLIISEEIEQSSPENFIVNGDKPTGLVQNEDTVEIEMADPLPVLNQLTVLGVADLAGNVMEDANYEFVHYSYQPIPYGAVVFNEIFPDPTPPEDLPETEFIEIINSSNFAIYMTGWSLSDRNAVVELPSIKLLPDSIVLLHKESATIDWTLDNAISLAKWPSLNNSGDDLWLKDSSGNVIDALSYDLAMYGEELKAEGGWSLERLDPYLPCTGVVNWAASIDPRGGTPGLKNSVFTRIIDKEPPLITGAQAISADSIIVQFDEPLGSLPEAVNLEGSMVIGFTYVESGLDQIVIHVNSLEPRSEYRLEIIGIKDCSGNLSEMQITRIVLPEHPAPGDLVINEILFNPRDDLNDYIEVFNQSPKYIALDRLIISNGENEKRINSTTIMAPGEYRVITPELEEILNNYHLAPIDNIITNELPSFVNAAGSAVLRDRAGTRLDSIRYNESWHFSYLNDVEGIALERLSPLRYGTEQANWASSSAQDNYGTPGYENSHKDQPGGQEVLNISPQVIVPNADGRDDFTTVTLNMSENAVATLRIYNLYGMEIRMLANNTAVAGKEYFTWDGTDAHGIAVPLGHYIIVADVVLENGRTASYRAKMVVGTGY